MNIKQASAFFLAWLLVASPLLADSVYTWTDEQGVRHYSNTGLPSEVQDGVEQFDEISSSPTAATDEPSDDASVDESPPEQIPETSEEEEAAAAEKQQMDQRLEAKVKRERQRLEAEIERIKGLAIGKSFTQGMKDAQIAPLQEQLALLEADPERYFRMKRQGAFDSGSGFSETAAGGPLTDTLGPSTGAPTTGRSVGGSEASPPSPPEETSGAITSEENQSGKVKAAEPGASLRSPEE